MPIRDGFGCGGSGNGEDKRRRKTRKEMSGSREELETFL